MANAKPTAPVVHLSRVAGRPIQMWYMDEHGQKIRKSTKTYDPHEAEDERRKWEAILVLGLPVTDSGKVAGPGMTWDGLPRGVPHQKLGDDEGSGCAGRRTPSRPCRADHQTEDDFGTWLTAGSTCKIACCPVCRGAAPRPTPATPTPRRSGVIHAISNCRYELGREVIPRKWITDRPENRTGVRSKTQGTT